MSPTLARPVTNFGTAIVINLGTAPVIKYVTIADSTIPDIKPKGGGPCHIYPGTVPVTSLAWSLSHNLSRPLSRPLSQTLAYSKHSYCEKVKGPIAVRP